MKTYQVTLRNSLGNAVLTHNMYAHNDMDAEAKANVLLSNARDKSVMSVSLQSK